MQFELVEPELFLRLLSEAVRRLVKRHPPAPPQLILGRHDWVP